MKNILKIYRNDIKNILKNPVALLIIVGICIIPSLYAWVNIKACWDPYSKTSNIPVAVVNNDVTVEAMGKKINVGNEVVDKLKKNHQIGWKFVSLKEADMGIVDGTYYAIIEIPKDFSKDFTSVLSDKIKKPQIIYKADTKVNPVAGKITDTAKNSLVNQISTSFISTVNQVIFSSLNGIGKDADKNKKDLIILKENIIDMDKNMDTILGTLDNINDESSGINTFLTEIKASMPSLNSGLSSIESSNMENQSIVESTQNTFNNSMSNIELSLTNAQSSIYRISGLLKNVNSSVSSASSSEVNSELGNISMEINTLGDNINSTVSYLEEINNASPNADVSNLIASLKNIQSSLNNEKTKINDIQEKYKSANEIEKNTLDSADDEFTNMGVQITNAVKEYNEKAKSSLNQISGNLINVSNDASSLIESAQGLNSQIDNIMTASIDGTNLISNVSGDLRRKLSDFRGVISELSDELKKTSADEISTIIAIFQSNPKFMGDFISNPFDIKEEPIYEVPNYGSGMSPIYTVLAMWVGSLLLTSILKTDSISYVKGIKKITLKERYYGKMLTFVTLGAIQGLIVSIGNKAILGVYTVSTPLMITVCLISSITFTIITYTLVSVLGNVGKAVSIVFMIVQIAGSGGSYPIQVDPLIFRIMQPFFPFTYSIGGLRESIAGPLISSTAFDLIMLISFSILFIVLGFFFKKLLYDRVYQFEAKFKESGIGE